MLRGEFHSWPVFLDYAAVLEVGFLWNFSGSSSGMNACMLPLSDMSGSPCRVQVTDFECQTIGIAS